jgi:hypothetical protein
LGLLSVSAAFLLIFNCCRDWSWPEGYVVHENFDSPDHHFGLLVPGSDVDLKKRDVTKSVGKKSKLIEKRTKALRDLDWFCGR